MDPMLNVAGLGGDDLRSLNVWLNEEPELQGGVTLLQRSPQNGELPGGVLTGLAVALAPGGIAVVLARSLVSWLRRRPSGLSMKLTTPDGVTIEIESPGTRASVDDIRRLIDRLIRFLEGGDR